MSLPTSAVLNEGYNPPDKPHDPEAPLRTGVEINVSGKSRPGLRVLFDHSQINQFVGVVQETRSTVAEILRQILLLVILAMRLYTIPLSYLCRKVGASGVIALPSRLGPSANISQEQGEVNFETRVSNGGAVSAGWCVIVSMVDAWFRIEKTLFLLLKLLEQEPRLFVTPQNSPTHPGFSQNIFRRPSWTLDRYLRTAQNQEEEYPPPTASQIYHASLAGDRQLDDILAALENEHSSKINSDAETTPHSVRPDRLQKPRGSQHSVQSTLGHVMQSSAPLTMEEKPDATAAKERDLGTTTFAAEDDVLGSRSDMRFEEIGTIDDHRLTSTLYTTFSEDEQGSCSIPSKLCKSATAINFKKAFQFEAPRQINITTRPPLRAPRLSPLPENFENIYLDLSTQAGRCRLAESGLGWKPSGGTEPFTLDSSQIGGAQWSRASKGYELKIMTRDGAVIQLDGFEQEDFDRITKAFKIWYGSIVESKEHALRGWNWGKAEFGRAELAFNVQNRPAFEIPYSEISNTNLAGKNEIAVEFSLEAEPTTNGVNGHKAGNTKNRGRKAAAGRDELVEMRFYIPGTVSKKEVNGDDTGSGDEPDEEDETNAANLFYETLMDKAEIGDVAGTTFATFQDILHLTPRGRFDVDMYESSFRLRGKTYDYKIQYQSIKKFFILPKNDELHTLITLGLDPPLRQGQTRYPFIVMQLKLDEEVNLELNMTEELLETKYKNKLDPHYEAPIHHVMVKVFKGLSGKKIIMPSKDFVSHHNMNGVKCSIKANEGLLFCLDKSFMFVPKPATYVPIENIGSITMSRVGGALAASRTFDITMTLKSGQGEHQFSNINREEQQPLEDFFKAKNIRVKNEMLDDSSTLLKAALQTEDMATSSDDDQGAAMRGSADEDDETPDEDFEADSDSDVAEEYDSNAASSGSDAGSDAGDAEMNDKDASAGSDEEEHRPKKKTKTKG